MQENEIASAILDVSFKLHKQYGPGLFESVYEELLCHKLAKLGISIKQRSGRQTIAICTVD